MTAMTAWLTGHDFAGCCIASEMRPGVRFELELCIGRGGTAAAYYARRVSPEGESPAVVKVIHPEVVQGGTVNARLLVQKEAVALGRLNERIPPSPFVIRFMDAGDAPYASPSGAKPELALPWVALEYVHGGIDGTRLETRVENALQQKGHAFDRARAARAMRHVCEGLSEVHAVGVIHRDVKPNNVLCCGFGDHEIFKLSDFGIARPQGLASTLGPGMHGTMGYAPPEQIIGSKDEMTPATDVFGLAATLFFVLTGKDLFSTENPVALLRMIEQPRKKLEEFRGLAPGLREDREARVALDEAIARGTAMKPEDRFPTAKAFANAVLPWLSPAPTRLSLMPTEPEAPPLVVPSLAPPPIASSGPEALPGWLFTIRRTPSGERTVSSMAWDADGHGLAATSRGLAFWNGSEWLPAPLGELFAHDTVRCVRRVGTGRWIVGGTSAIVAEYSRSGVTRIVRGLDPRLTFSLASGDVDDLAVVVGESPGAPPVLCAISGGRWLRPLPVEQALSITSLARVADSEWLLSGRGRDGHGFVARYSPTMWSVEPLTVPHSRAYLACAGRPERESGVAVGADGAVVRVEAGRVVTAGHVEEGPSLACVAVDLLDRIWAGALGSLWVSDDGESWICAWYDSDWQVPFVSVLAEPGRVLAMTADGAVIEARAKLPRRSASGGTPISRAGFRSSFPPARAT